MQTSARITTTLALFSSLLLASCAEISKVLEDSGAMSMGGAAIGGIVGRETKLGGNRSRGAAYGAGLGALGGWGISQAYKYSVSQRQYAQEQANRALVQNRSVMKSLKAKGGGYMAVPVKAERGNPESKSGIVRVKVKEQRDGRLKAESAESTVYPMTKVGNGSVVKVGGQDAVFYQP